MKARIFAILGALTLAVGFGIGSGQAAYAASPQHQYCNAGYCLNAWNEGPYVNAYTVNHVNNDFYAFKNPSSGYENIEYTGPGPRQGQCVSDYGNSSGDARAGISGQCQNSNVSWGANFELVACNNGDSGWAFRNVHWNGWLTPNSHSDGSPFYLNSQTETCYSISGAG
jgi:hypothetical protein